MTTQISIAWSGELVEADQIAIQWLIGDVNGDGFDELIQLWDNGGRLGVNIYGWTTDPTGRVVLRNPNENLTLYGTDDIGQGYSGVFLVGDINGDGSDELIQLWDNNGRLAM